MIKHLIDRLNRTARYTHRFKLCDPFIAFAGRHDFFQHWNELLTVNDTLTIGHELWVGRVLGDADCAAK